MFIYLLLIRKKSLEDNLNFLPNYLHCLILSAVLHSLMPRGKVGIQLLLPAKQDRYLEKSLLLSKKLLIHYSFSQREFLQSNIHFSFYYPTKSSKKNKTTNQSTSEKFRKIVIFNIQPSHVLSSCRRVLHKYSPVLFSINKNEMYNFFFIPASFSLAIFIAMLWFLLIFCIF